ncbi:ribosomal protein L1 [Aaosphaeria arxii CBS 175.79]|uniref:Ribosomal protein L1 n=1 Tax=Aaosphaeria arxii CBS 175.79 TaxID=1450172 RepID=A0A6A5XBY2_9PLEO|nr:ribosomal protein L1 [Aaosphaeria arxii CBS 175.79]KAF2010419.1 ribosomal protein L1 [Aaosphaeria arxii CBS 175.79]
MARSKQAKKTDTPKKSETSVAKSKPEAPLTSKVSNGTPYQLDPAQVERAATALIAHMKKHAQEKEEKASKKNLAADEDEPETSDAAIFLNLTTKQHVKDNNRLRPNKIALPHTIQPSEIRICLIVADPQREYKNIVAADAFPEDVRAKVHRVIGVDKLKKKYKTYETRRQLLAEYDLFLADDRVTDNLSKVLGSTFYKGKGKRPVPVTLSVQTPKDKDGKRKYVAKKPEDVAKEIESALSSTYVHLSPSATTSIRVGKLSQQPQQIQENIEAAVSAVVAKFVTNGWRNVRALHIKGPATMALPIWLADELWANEAQVLEEPWKPAPKEVGPSEKKRKWDAWEEELLDDDELAERREQFAAAKKSKAKDSAKDKESRSISKASRKKLKQDALKSVQTPLIA